MFHRTINPAGGHSANLMVITPETVAFLDVLRADIDKGRIDLDSAAEELGKPSLGRMIRAAPRMLTRAGHGSLPLFFASATGMFDGRAMRVVARIADDSPVSELLSDMAGATGIPLGARPCSGGVPARRRNDFGSDRCALTRERRRPGSSVHCAGAVVRSNRLE